MTNDVNGIPSSSLKGITDVAGSRKVDNKQQPADTASESASQSARDTVALTDGARLLQRVESELANASEIDSKRVSELKESIATGSYKVDDRAIADKVLRSDSERS